MDDKRRMEVTTAGLNLIAQALSIYDDRLRLSVCNAPFQQMFNLPDALVTPGARFDETIRHLVVTGEYGPIDDVESFVAERVEQASAFEPHYMERTRANGRTISVEGSPLPQGGWVTVYTDISQSKAQETLLRTRSEELSGELLSRAEELASTNRKLAATITALEETKRQLTRSEAQIRLTAEMMPAHIAHVDRSGIYTYSNRRLSSIMPGRPSHIIGLTLRDALGEGAYLHIAPHMEAAYRGERSVFEFTYTPSARRIRVAFTPDGHGGFYILSMDITEETQARAALQQTRRRNLAAQMTSGLAHDFSNLLTIILGLQGRLKRMENLPEGAAALVDGTLAATKRGGALLDRIGDMTAARPYRPRATQLDRVLLDIAMLARSTLPDGLRLDLDLDLPKTPLLLDPGMLQDAVLNLILNARDACGTPGHIQLNAKLVGQSWVELSVTDDGPGFSPTVIERALEPFYTTKGSDGSGLGLPMVYDMTQLAGGTLELHNVEPTGARVTLRLPLREAPSVSGGLVLLVEDDADLRSGTREMLTSLGHAVIEATSVEEAASLLEAVPDIALILSDLKLAGEATGVDLARSTAVTGPVMILMTSLPADDPLHQDASTLAPVLQKPFSAQDLADLLALDVPA
ncbi:response regulator [Aliishimia ponticola]|uniref:histidine kinase n=1 Tax=Aliishimia ponticola TaxID=2499833 RepID=A0A4S4NBC6_9RHOB|nr:PAS-domain containing protein [Aliishimia ponticola]THH35281.1 response regulator [Aliishimia ponticola]